MERVEPVIEADKPACIVVFGDVNSTAACALVAAKLLVPVVHVEAGLRSFDRTMPEEINRIVTDALSGLLLTSEPAGRRNLLAEGRPEAADRRHRQRDDRLARAHARRGWRRWSRGAPTASSAAQYGLVTLHRPSNVDDPAVLQRVLQLPRALRGRGAAAVPGAPAHPGPHRRARAVARPALRLVDPVDYIESLALQAGAAVIFTDSGGIQEEASHLDVPCLTLRPNTERPITVELGTSTLVGNDPAAIEQAFRANLAGSYKKATPIPLWDGHAAERAAAAIEGWLSRT